MKASDLAGSEEWCNGPMFLSLPEQQWPTRPDTSLIEESVLSENKGELKKEAVPVSTNLVSEPEEKTSLSGCIGLEHVSTKKKLFRGKKDQEHKEHSEPPDQLLSVKELEAAELLWFQEVQTSIVCDDKFNQQNLSLGLFLDDMGIYRWTNLRCHIKQSIQRCCLQNTTCRHWLFKNVMTM